MTGRATTNGAWSFYVHDPEARPDAGSGGTPTRTPGPCGAGRALGDALGDGLFTL